MENSADTVSVRELRRAAYVANQLNEFIERASRAKAIPMLIGYDLDHLSEQFTEAADKMAAAQ